MDPNIIVEVGSLMTVRNLNNVMRDKQKEFRPTRKRIGRMGTRSVAVRRNTTGVYEL